MDGQSGQGKASQEFQCSERRGYRQVDISIAKRTQCFNSVLSRLEQVFHTASFKILFVKNIYNTIDI